MRYGILFFLGGMLLCLPGTASADSVGGPESYKIVVGRYVFVMLVRYCKGTQQELEMTDANKAHGLTSEAHLKWGHNRMALS